MTQRELARIARISPRTISDLERGVYPTAKLSTTRQLVSALQLDGEERRVFEMVARGQSVPATSALPAMGPAALSSLPTPVAPFIGRAAELGELHTLLAHRDVRLLTLIGPGGTGKTRIAIEAARGAADRFPDGVYFIPLAALSDPRLMLPTIARSLGLQERSGEPIEDTLVECLRPKRVLLVLDNLEHMVEAGPDIIQLLEAASQLTVIATSRVVLHLSGEYLFPVQPMTLPRDEHVRLEELVRYDATALFLARFQAVIPGFTLTEDIAPVIAAICTRLDGLPLAIELAAAQCRFFSPAAVLERLAQGLGVLGEGPRDAPARQRTLQATIDWSYRLLDPADQALFARLSVFAGGATIPAIEAVCGGEDVQDIGETLIHLLDASLLVHDGGDESRVAMLETVRRYAAQRLRERGEEDEIKRRHAQFYRDLSRAARPGMEGAEEAWLTRMEDEYDNIRAMLSWFLDRDAEEILRLSNELGRFWQVRGYWEEGCRWLEEALARERGAPAGLQGGAMRMWGWLEFHRGNEVQAEARLRESIGLLRGTENEKDLAAALYQVGFLWKEKGELEDAQVLMQESLHHSRGSDDASVITRIFGLGSLADVARMRGNHEDAIRFAEEAVHLAREHDTGSRLMFAVAILGSAAVAAGQYALAEETLREQLALARQLGATLSMSIALNNLGEAAWEQGHLEEAQEHYEEALALRGDGSYTHHWATVQHNLAKVLLSRGDVADSIKRLRSGWGQVSRLAGDMRVAGDYLSLCAQALALAGRPAAATRLHAASNRIYAQMGYVRNPGERALEEQAMAHARRALDDAAWKQAWHEGEAMTVDEAIDFALGEIESVGSTAQQALREID